MSPLTTTPVCFDEIPTATFNPCYIEIAGVHTYYVPQ